MVVNKQTGKTAKLDFMTISKGITNLQAYRGGGSALSWQCVPLLRLAWPVNREVQCIIIQITALYRISALYCKSRMTGNARRDNGTR